MFAAEAQDISLASQISAATSDAIEQLVISTEANVARLRHLQTLAIRELDSRQIPLADGCRTMTQWVSSRADVGQETARALVRVANRHNDRLDSALEDGDISFDRAAELSRLDDPTDLRLELDIGGLRRIAGFEIEISVGDERQAFERRHLIAQPDLSATSWKLTGQIPALEGAQIFSTLDEIADALPAAPSGHHETRSARRVDALNVLCDRTIANEGEGSTSADHIVGPRRSGVGASSGQPDVFATVIVDAVMSAPSDGRRGAWMVGGPRVGPATLERILCAGIVEITAKTSDGDSLAVGDAQTAIPPRTRRAVLARDHGRCTTDGCESSYRLQPHHIGQRSDGGNNQLCNLTSLCWYHHHVVIHGRGFTIDPTSPPGRRRFIRQSRVRAGPS